MAFRLALDAVHRMHENELQSLHGKLKNCQEELDRLQQIATQTNRQNNDDTESDNPITSINESNNGYSFNFIKNALYDYYPYS